MFRSQTTNGSSSQALGTTTTATGEGDGDGEGGETGITRGRQEEKCAA